MRNFISLLRFVYLLSLVSLLIGIIAKLLGTNIVGVSPLSYLRFTGICILYVIALNLTQISLKK